MGCAAIQLAASCAKTPKRPRPVTRRPGPFSRLTRWVDQLMWHTEASRPGPRWVPPPPSPLHVSLPGRPRHNFPRDGVVSCLKGLAKPGSGMERVAIGSWGCAWAPEERSAIEPLLKVRPIGAELTRDGLCDPPSWLPHGRCCGSDPLLRLGGRSASETSALQRSRGTQTVSALHGHCTFSPT